MSFSKGPNKVVQDTFERTDTIICLIDDLMQIYKKYPKMTPGYTNAEYHLSWAICHMVKILDATSAELIKRDKSKDDAVH